MSLKVRIDKVLSIIAFVFLAWALYIIAITPPASGYEISIYSAYPGCFWLLLGSAIACGIFILIRHASPQMESSKWWLSGLFIVIFGNLIVMWLPLFRGYFLADLADEASHLGFIRDIVLHGHFGKSNYYPVSHILAVSLSYISGLDLTTIIKVSPSIFYLVYMLGLFVFSRALAQRLGQVLMVMAFGSVLLFTYFSVLFLPVQFALCLSPLILMLLQKRSLLSGLSVQHSLCFLIFLVLIPFLHPMTALFLVATFLIYETCTRLGKRMGLGHRLGAFPHSVPSVLPAAALLFIVFFTWFSAFAIFQAQLWLAYTWFVFGIGRTPMEGLLEILRKEGFTAFEIIRILINNYGHDLLFILLSAAASLIVWRKVFSPHGREKATVGEVFLSSTFLLFSLFFMWSLIVPFVTSIRSLRVYSWPLMVAVVLNGLVLGKWLADSKGIKFQVSRVLLTGIILVAMIIGMLSVYDSPHIQTTNLQLTEMDWVGMEWYYAYKDPGMTVHLGEFAPRARDGIFGIDSSAPVPLGIFLPTPPQLGYDPNSKYSSSGAGWVISPAAPHEPSLTSIVWMDSYVITTTHARTYVTLHPKRWDISADDLNKLNSDYAVGRIYYNGDLEVWRITR